MRLVKKIRVYHADGLHAKVYLFDRTAVVCSANLSASSSGERLLEAGVPLAAPSEIKAIREYVHRVLQDSVAMDPTLLRARARLEPRRAAGRPAPQRHRGVFAWGDRVWVIASDEDPGETAAERRAKTKWMESEGYQRNSLQWFNECGLKIYQQVAEKHTVFFWESPTRRRPLGYLRGPFISRGGADLGARRGTRRYALAIQPKQQRDVALDITRLARLRGIVGYRRDATHDEAPVRVEVPGRRLREFARLVGVPRSPDRT
jgi:hypothetical protein